MIAQYMHSCIKRLIFSNGMQHENILKLRVSLSNVEKNIQVVIAQNDCILKKTYQRTSRAIELHNLSLHF